MRTFSSRTFPRSHGPTRSAPWYLRFVDCFDALSDRIALGHLADDEVTICTGEEMALHLLIDFAQGEFDSGFDSDAEALDQLPDHWFWWARGDLNPHVLSDTGT